MSQILDHNKSVTDFDFDQRYNKNGLTDAQCFIQNSEITGNKFALASIVIQFLQL